MIHNNYYILLLLLVISACETKNDKILFSSSRNGNSDIFIMDADGKNKTALTGPDCVDNF